MGKDSQNMGVKYFMKCGPTHEEKKGKKISEFGGEDIFKTLEIH